MNIYWSFERKLKFSLFIMISTLHMVPNFPTIMAIIPMVLYLKAFLVWRQLLFPILVTYLTNVLKDYILYILYILLYKTLYLLPVLSGSTIL